MIAKAVLEERILGNCGPYPNEPATSELTGDPTMIAQAVPKERISGNQYANN